jgi:hypothetical protein
MTGTTRICRRNGKEDNQQRRVTLWKIRKEKSRKKMKLRWDEKRRRKEPIEKTWKVKVA